MTTVSTLNVAYGSIGAQATLDTLRTVSGAVVEAGKAAVNAYADNERYGASLASLSAAELVNTGQSKDLAAARDLASVQAQRLLGWSQKLAVLSPYGQDNAINALRLAESYGFVASSADKNTVSATRLTQAIFDYAAAAGLTGAVTEQLARSFGQVQSMGKLAGGEVLQFSNAGLNAKNIVADFFHITTDEAQRMISDGLVPADKAILALTQNLEKNYGGAAAAQSDTIGGLINSLQDLEQVSLRSLFGPTIRTLQNPLSDLTGYLQTNEAQESLTHLGDGLARNVQVAVDGVRFIVENGDVIARGGSAALLGTGAAAGLNFAITKYNELNAAGRTYEGTILGLTRAQAGQLAITGLFAAEVTALALGYQYVSNLYDEAAQKLYAQSQGAAVAAEAFERLRRIRAGIISDADAAKQQPALTLEGEAATVQRMQDDYQKALSSTGFRQGLVGSLKDAATYIAGANPVFAVNTYGLGLLGQYLLGDTDGALRQQKATLDRASAAFDQHTKDVLDQLQKMQQDAAQKQADEQRSLAEKQLYAGLVKGQVDFGLAEIDRANDYSAKLQHIEGERRDKLVTAEDSYHQSLITISRNAASQRLDEERSYGKKLADIAKERQQALAEAARTASTEGAAALGSATAQDIDYLNGNESRLSAHVEKRRLLERQGAFCKLPEEESAYRAQERQAALAYVNQEKALQQSLGRQLIDYTTAQALIYGVAQKNLDAMTDAIRSRYGLQQSASEQAFGRMRTVIDQWAQSGGQSTSGYIDQLGALQDSAVATQQRIEELTKAKTDALVGQRSRGEISQDDYLHQLRAIPASVNREVGLPNSTEPSQVLVKQRQLDEQATQARIGHSQRLADIDRNAGQQRADAANTYGKAVADANGKWYHQQKDDAQKAYAQQELQAGLAYTRQYRQQYDALKGQTDQFKAYVDHHLAEDARMQIGLDVNAQKRLAAIEARRRKDASYTDAQYQSDLNNVVSKAYTTYLPLAAPQPPPRPPQSQYEPPARLAPPTNYASPPPAPTGGRGYQATSYGGRPAPEVHLHFHGDVDSHARVQEIATIAKREVMAELNQQVDDTILAPPKTRNV